MYMNGRGPGMNGRRGPMGGPVYRRPVRMVRRPMGFFPLGGLFIVPGLLFGGWIVGAVLTGIFSLLGSIIGGLARGLAGVAPLALTGSGIFGGIVIGLFLFLGLKKRREARKENESAGTVDGEAVQVQISEPAEEVYAETRYMNR